MPKANVIGEYEVNVHLTKDKKKLKEGVKEYAYGTINIRDPRLAEYIGRKVMVSVSTEVKKKTKSSL